MGGKPTPLTYEVFRAANKHPGTSCMLARFISGTLSVADQKATFDAIADPTIQISAIHRVLRERGFPGSRESIARTRAGCTECNKLQKSLGR